MRRFAQVDVFGDKSGDGNPLAVVVDGDGLSTEQMQRLANWTNLSETTFLLAPTEPAADYRVRIFTTSRELPFAGHPTLGSAHAWLEHHGEAERGSLVQECGAGLVELRRAGGRLAFAAPPLRRSGPLDAATLDELTATLGVSRDEVVDHAWTDNGPGWASVLLSSAERVLALRPTSVSSGCTATGPPSCARSCPIRGSARIRSPAASMPASPSGCSATGGSVPPTWRVRAPRSGDTGASTSIATRRGRSGSVAAPRPGSPAPSPSERRTADPAGNADRR
jgi:hypothetical protein